MWIRDAGWVIGNVQALDGWVQIEAADNRVSANLRTATISIFETYFGSSTSGTSPLPPFILIRFIPAQSPTRPFKNSGCWERRKFANASVYRFGTELAQLQPERTQYPPLSTPPSTIRLKEYRFSCLWKDVSFVCLKNLGITVLTKIRGL
jgi:hypothetical protein